MKKVLIHCVEKPFLRKQFKTFVDYRNEERKDLNIEFSEKSMSQLPDGYDGYHINANKFELEELKRLRKANPKSLIFGTGILIREYVKDREKLKQMDHFSPIYSGSDMEKFLDDVENIQ